MADGPASSLPAGQLRRRGNGSFFVFTALIAEVGALHARGCTAPSLRSATHSSRASLVCLLLARLANSWRFEVVVILLRLEFFARYSRVREVGSRSRIDAGPEYGSPGSRDASPEEGELTPQALKACPSS